jgi:hypothetical protein
MLLPAFKPITLEQLTGGRSVVHYRPTSKLRVVTMHEIRVRTAIGESVKVLVKRLRDEER